MAIYCDGCGKKLFFQYKKLYNANFCDSCWKKLKADTLIKEDYSSLDDAIQAGQELIKLAQQNNFNKTAISEIEDYFTEIKSREYPLFVADGGLRQKIKIFSNKCIIYTELNFPYNIPELTSELNDVQREINNSKKIIREADARADYAWANRSLTERINDYKNAPTRKVLKDVGGEEGECYWVTVKDLRKPSEKRKEKESLDLQNKENQVKDDYAPRDEGSFNKNLEKLPDVGDYYDSSRNSPKKMLRREFSTEILSTDEQHEAFNRIHDIRPGKRTILLYNIKDAVFFEPKNNSFGYIKLIRMDGIPGAPHIFFSSANTGSMRQAFLQEKYLLQKRDSEIRRIQQQEEYKKINYCPYCGFKVQSSEMVYCINCGKKLK
jgi:hypothetical protein